MTEPRPSDHDSDKAPAQKDAEHFKHELEFLENVSGLIDLLRKNATPVRKTYTYETLCMGRGALVYPPSLDRFIGTRELSSLAVTVAKEEDASSTTIELFGSFGRVYISRDAMTPQKTEDSIINDAGEELHIGRIPDSEINDLLYSIAGRNKVPTETRDYTEDERAESVVGDGMRDALETSVVRTSTDYTYELGDERVVWCRFEGLRGDEKLASVTLRYLDNDMNRIVVDIVMEKGLKIGFKQATDNQPLLNDVFPDRQDYVIALRVIREETRKLTSPVYGRRPISLSSLPPDVLNTL